MPGLVSGDNVLAESMSGLVSGNNVLVERYVSVLVSGDNVTAERYAPPGQEGRTERLREFQPH